MIYSAYIIVSLFYSNNNNNNRIIQSPLRSIPLVSTTSRTCFITRYKKEEYTIYKIS